MMVNEERGDSLGRGRTLYTWSATKEQAEHCFPFEISLVLVASLQLDFKPYGSLYTSISTAMIRLIITRVM